MAFIKATKKQSKLRMALFGTSGSGKTFSALRIATGLGKKIAVIDTERGSASKYSDRFSFDVCELEKPTVDNMVKTISEAEENGYDVLIIDSLTHAWDELLEEVDKLSKVKYHGNSWQAWSEGTPKQKQLVNAILNYNGHIIASMRTKTEWKTESYTDKNGYTKTKPVRIGLSPEQGKGIEYEFDILLEVSPEHIANVIKDRTGKFQDELIEKPDEKFGKALLDWLNSGEFFEKPKVENQQQPENKPEKTTIQDNMKILEVNKFNQLYLSKHLLDDESQIKIEKMKEYLESKGLNFNFEWVIKQNAEFESLISLAKETLKPEIDNNVNENNLTFGQEEFA